MGEKSVGEKSLGEYRGRWDAGLSFPPSQVFFISQKIGTMCWGSLGGTRQKP